MSVKLKSDISESGIVLYDPSINIDKLPENKELLNEFPDVGNAFDEFGNLRYLSVDLWEGNTSFLDELITYFEEHPVPGKYTVEELGLYDVSFTEVLRAVRKLYEEKQKVSV